MALIKVTLTYDDSQYRQKHIDGASLLSLIMTVRHI